MDKNDVIDTLKKALNVEKSSKADLAARVEELLDEVKGLKNEVARLETKEKIESAES